MKTYTAKIIKGSLPEHGTEYWTEEHWLKHEEYIEELKRTGEYGKEVEVEVTLVPNSIFDEVEGKDSIMISYGFVILDMDNMTIKELK